MESAARNFRERIKSVRENSSELPYISTIHGLALRIIKENGNVISSDLEKFLLEGGKRIRPRIVLLILKMLNLEITPNHQKLCLALELLHNATLLHDDVIDNAILRRERETINYKYNDKTSTLLGDFILSLALKKLSEINNPKVIEIFSDNILQMTKGELNQQFQKNQIPNISDYIEKTKNKTALLFWAGVKSALLISNYSEHLEEIKDFVLNFGISFQINNDLKSGEDKKNGIYTLPYILFKQENKTCDIIDCDNQYFEKSKEFLSDLVNKTKGYLDFINNDYKCEILKITEKLKEIQ